MCVGGEAAALSPHCSSEEPCNTLTLALKQACIFQNEDTDPEHELHKKEHSTTSSSDTERRCITPKEGPGEKWADDAQG